MYVILSQILILISMLKPFLLFKKTPLWMGNQQSFYLFYHILYTNYNSEQTPLISTFVIVTQVVILFIMLVVGEGVLGRRVGPVPASIQRFMYFVVIVALNSSCLIISKYYELKDHETEN
jgi:uncharacterized membrane-anchored protein